jgi:hypothetical protein
MLRLRGKCRFSVEIQSITYEFLTDCSGLPDVRFAMLPFGAGEVSSSNLPHSLRNGAYVVPCVLQAMTLIVLATICFLACVFLLFVLVQWMRDGNRKTKTSPAVDGEVGETRDAKHPHIVGGRRTVERHDRFKVRSHGVTVATERSGGRESEYDERERMAYERIAKLFKLGKRS